MQAGEHQMGMLGWTGDSGDPDNFLNTLLGCKAAKINGSIVDKFRYQPLQGGSSGPAPSPTWPIAPNSTCRPR